MLDFGWPDALWIAAEQHSERCYVIWILDCDYSYNEWIAHLSLDERWTVSPVRGPWHTAETGKQGKEGTQQWRGIKGRSKARRRMS